MPNRIIREGWLESERINALDAADERFFLRLLLRADDFGRYYATPMLLKSNLFPLSEEVRCTDISRWLAACEKAGLLRCYQADDRRFLEIPRFDQRTRAMKSRFPAPNGTPDERPPPTPDDGHLPDERQSGDCHPRTYSETDSKSEAESTAAAKPASAQRARNPLFDAFAAACLADPTQMTTPEARACGVALASIMRVTPAADAAEFSRRALAYRRKYREAALTPSALARHWGELAPAAAAPAKVNLPEPDPGWRQKFSEAYPHHLLADDSRPWKDMSVDTQRTLTQLLKAAKGTGE